MVACLGGCIISILGDFGSKRSQADCKRWIEANGGEYSAAISARVTHLVCSEANWKAGHPLVKSALKQPRTHIVSYDWLEDTLLDRKKKSVGRYRWAFLEQEREEQANEKKAVVRNYVDSKQPAKAFQAGCECAQQDLHSDNYHIYRDDSSFPYNIVLTRADAVGTNVDKVTLRLYESNTHRPSQYAVVATYDKHEPTGKTPVKSILVPIGSPYHKAFGAYRKTFQQLTGVEWDFRMYNNAIPLDMASKRALRHEGWRIEVMIAEHMEQIGSASKKFLNGDDSNDITSPYQEKTSNRFVCYQYLLPQPSQGEPRGSEGLARFGRECYGDTRVEAGRVGGGSRDLVQPNVH